MGQEDKEQLEENKEMESCDIEAQESTVADDNEATPDLSSDDEPIADAIGLDADDSGLDIVDVPVIGEAAEQDEATQAYEALGDTGEMPVVGAAKGASDDDSQEESKKSHTARNIVIALVLIIVLAIAGCVGWLVYDDARNASCHVAQGVTLDGTDISGCSESEVKSIVTKHVLSGQAGSLKLSLSIGQTVTLEFAKLGDVDVDATVQAAMATIDPDMFSRCLKRAKEIVGLDAGAQETQLSTVCKLSKKKVTQKVQDIADQYDKEVRDAGYEFDEQAYKVKTVKAKEGYELDVAKTVKRIIKASKNGETSIEAQDSIVEPTKTTPGQAIFVSLSECHLYFYVDGKVKKDYACTPGMSGYDTPRGSWTLEYKDASPTWYNPGSDWAKSMPDTIGPGASNPLGLRALALSCGGGIYIHGTTNYGQLGTAASHGCIRLANENVVELFDLVETGIPIFVY